MVTVDVITINRPEVLALIEEAARKLTRGIETESVTLPFGVWSMRSRVQAPFSEPLRIVLRVQAGVDVLAPALDVEAN